MSPKFEMLSDEEKKKFEKPGEADLTPYIEWLKSVPLGERVKVIPEEAKGENTNNVKRRLRKAAPLAERMVVIERTQGNVIYLKVFEDTTR